MGIQWAQVKVQKSSNPRQPRLNLGVISQAMLVTRSLRKQVVHTTGPHVKRPFVWMKTVPRVPVNSVEAKGKGHNDDEEQ